MPPQKHPQIIPHTHIPHNTDKGWPRGMAGVPQRRGKPTRAVRPRSPPRASAKGEGDEVPQLARQDLQLQRLAEGSTSEYGGNTRDIVMRLDRDCVQGLYAEISFHTKATRLYATPFRTPTQTISETFGVTNTRESVMSKRVPTCSEL